MGFGNEKFAGFGKALKKNAAKKKIVPKPSPENDTDTDEDKDKKKKKSSWAKYFRLGSGGRSKTSAQENQGK